MSRSTSVAAVGAGRVDRMARAAERTLRIADASLRILVRGERFDGPDGDMAALRDRLNAVIRGARVR